MAVRLSINLAGDAPASRQIVDNLRVMLVEGKLKAGDELPSVRRMAMELNVHFNTVAEAYRVLAAEGWLDLKHGRSARVVERGKRTASKKALGNWRTRLKQLTAQMISEGLSKAEVMEELRKASAELGA